MKAGLSQAVLLALASSAVGVPMPSVEDMAKREVPQEHSHDLFLSITREALNKNNPKQIKDVVFGLLGNAAAAGGAGQVTNLDCLQQETADQAFTNGKAAGDVRLMSAALVYRALERNTGKVGLASVKCTEKAANPEIDAVQQHQDPASANAAAVNKAITLSLAKQLQSIGADPELALMSGTFAPGNLNDNTAKGNTCDTPDEQLGCIFSEGKLVLDATQQEIAAAVASTPAGSIKAGAGAGTPLKASALVDFSKFATASGAKGNSGSAAQPKPSKASPPAAASSQAASPSPAAAATGNNVQTFTGSLGGPPPPVISSASERPFSVNGDTFLNAAAALGRSCDVQHNACANAANSGKLSGGVGQCDTQNNACHAAISGASAANASSGQQQQQPAKAATGTGCDQQQSNNNKPAASNSQPQAQAGSGSSSNFGSCSDPGIKFANGLDGRKEPAFAPRNAASFNHGSALNIGVISDFICGQLKDKCKADSGVVAKCQAASADAKTKTGQAAADAFNSALGV